MSPKHVSWELLKDDEIRALLEEHGDEKTAKAVAVLMHQPYIKDQSKTIGDLVTQLASATGENIKVRRIARFQLGEAA
jgi:elongation factor Ts